MTETPQEEQLITSDFQRYMENNPEMSEQIMKIVSTLYNKPMKVSQVQQYLRDMFAVEEVNPDLEDSLRQENSELYDEIFDLQDRVVELEKELEDAREENEGL